MTLRKQNILFSLFLIAFLVSAPLVVLTTAGYRYSFIRNRWEKTGVIQVDATPSGATVHIETLGINKKTPATLSRLLPDHYDVVVEKEGYTTWQKTIDVKSGQTTFINQIVLYKKEAPIKIIPGDIVSMNISEDGWLVAAVHNNEHIEIWRTRNDTPTLMSIIDDAENATISFSKDGTIIFVTTPENIALIPIYAPLSPTIVTRNECQNFLPFPNGITIACVTTEHKLNILSLTNDIVRSSTINNVTQIVPWQEGFLALTKEETLHTLWQINEKNDKQLVTLPREITSIGAQTDDAVLLNDNRGINTVIVRPNNLGTPTVLPFALTGITHEKNTPYVAWNTNEIYLLNDNFSASLLTRITTPILHASSIIKGHSVLYTTTEDIRAIETDLRNKPLTSVLEANLNISKATAYTSDVYYISHDTENPGIFVRHLK